MKKKSEGNQKECVMTDILAEEKSVAKNRDRSLFLMTFTISN